MIEKTEELKRFEEENEIEFKEDDYGEYYVEAQTKEGIVQVASSCIMMDIEFRVEEMDLLILTEKMMKKLNEEIF